MENLQNQTFLYLQRPWGIRKALWISVVLVAAALSIKEISEKVIYYLEKPMTTLVQVEYPKEISFPNIVLCNSNQYKVTSVGDHLYRLITLTYEHLQTSSNWRHIQNYTDIIDQAFAETGITNANDFRKVAAHKLNDMILKCIHIDGSNCTDAFREVMTDFGVCYQMNGSTVASFRNAGRDSALTAYLNLEDYEHMQGPAHMLNSLKVLIYSENDYPLILSKSIDVSPGLITMIVLDYKQTLRELSTEGGSCGYKKSLEYFPDQNFYSKETCEFNKALIRLEVACGCTVFDGLRNNATHNCNFHQYFSCVLWHNSNLPTKSTSLNGEPCYPNCGSVNYAASLFSVEIPPQELLKLINSTQKEVIDNRRRLAQRTLMMREERYIEQPLSLHSKPIKMFGIPSANNLKQIKQVLNSFNNSRLKFEQMRLEPSYQESDSESWTWRAYEKFLGNESPTCYNNIKNKHAVLIAELGEKFFENFSLADDTLWQTLQEKIDNIETSRAVNRTDNTTTEDFGNSTEELITLLLDNYFSNINVMDSQTNNNVENTAITSLTNSNLTANYNRIAQRLLRHYISLAYLYHKKMWQFRPVEPNNWYSKQIEMMNGYIGNRLPFVEWALLWNYEDSNALVDYSKSLSDQYKYVCNNITETLTKIRVAVNSIAEFNKNDANFWNYFGFYVSLTASVFNETSSEVEPAKMIEANSLIKFFNEALACADDYSTAARQFRSGTTPTLTMFAHDLERLDVFMYQFTSQQRNYDNMTSFSNKIVGLKIYFADMTKQIVTERRAYSYSSLISDIGGSLGLFIGGSLLSCFELLDIIVHEFRSLMSRFYFRRKDEEVFVQKRRTGKPRQFIKEKHMCNLLQA